MRWLQADASSTKEQPMKAILFLTDEPGSPKLTLQNVAGIKPTVRPPEGAPGCNCDRWGHPCAGCVERNVQAQGGGSDFSTCEINKITTWNT
jgi:hypothetical protein